MKALVIANPAARRGRTGERWAEIERRIKSDLPEFELAFTERPGHARDIAAAAVAAGHRHLVAVGGDGTMNEVVNGMALAGGGLPPEDAVLSPIPTGTGNDACKALGLLDRPDAAYQALARRRVRRMDLIRVRCAGLEDGAVERLALVCATFGAAAEISYRTGRSRILKKLGGRFSYYAVTLMVTLTYGRHDVLLALDGETPRRETIYTSLACNAEHVGGGIRIAPGAETADGRLDLVTFGTIPRRDILLQRPSWLFEGRHIAHPDVSLRRARRLAAEGPAKILVDLDGETVGRLPFEAEILPLALAAYA